MLSYANMVAIAKARLKDAQVLLRHRRFDGAEYVCGYAVELALKARICRTLKWPEFPLTRKEFEAYQSFKTHSLVTLQALSGVDAKIRKKYMVEWSAVHKWQPESRYSLVGAVNQADCQRMLAAAKVLVRFLCRA